VPLSSPSSPSSPFHDHRGDGYDDSDDGEREYGGARARRHSRASRHRYSRSLTDAGPLPLPVPPGVEQSVGLGQSQSYSGASPKPGMRERAQSFADDGESGETARRRGSMGPPRTPFSASGFNLVLDLPEDPEVWTPEDVARYLGRVVRARTMSGGEGTLKPGNGGHNSNEALASDLAAFVREKQIGGRGFMRMSEADLDGYVFLSLILYPLSFARFYCPKFLSFSIWRQSIANKEARTSLCCLNFRRASLVSFHSIPHFLPSSSYIFSITSVLETIESHILATLTNAFWPVANILSKISVTLAETVAFIQKETVWMDLIALVFTSFFDRYSNFIHPFFFFPTSRFLNTY